MDLRRHQHLLDTVLPNQKACDHLDDSHQDVRGSVTVVNASPFHPGGVNVVFTDGSVRFVKSSVSYQHGTPSRRRTAARSPATMPIELSGRRKCWAVRGLVLAGLSILTVWNHTRWECSPRPRLPTDEATT